MILPNIIAVLLLSGVIAAETKKYLEEGHIADVDTDTIPLIEDIHRERGKLKNS
jgi:AGCS family alanine or glycine:cation symporter